MEGERRALDRSAVDSGSRLTISLRTANAAEHGEQKAIIFLLIDRDRAESG
mgnify:CR=1 FL=1